MSKRQDKPTVNATRAPAMGAEPAAYITPDRCYQCGEYAWCLAVVLVRPGAEDVGYAAFCPRCITMVASAMQAEAPDINATGPSLYKTVTIQPYEERT